MKYSHYLLCTTALLLFPEALALEASDSLPDAPQTATTSSTRPRAFKFEKVNNNPLNLPRKLRLRKRAETVLQHLDNQVCDDGLWCHLQATDRKRTFSTMLL